MLKIELMLVEAQITIMIMMMRHKTIKIKILTVLTLLLLPLEVFAQEGGGWFGFSWADAMGSIFRWLGYMFNAISGFFLWVAGALVDFTLTLNINRLTNNELVTVGWEISRDVANLGFVLVIIVIAFATIFRFKDYQAKTALKNLIIAAILVNFSLAIAGAVIDFSHVITNFFLQNRLGFTNSYELSGTMATAFGPQRLLLDGGEAINPNTDAGGALSGASTAAVLSITGMIFSVVFTSLTALGFLALAILLLIRFVFISFLLIIAPISWLLFAVPQWKGLFQKWWDNFIKWCFFAPIMMFFIYLIVLSAEELSNFPIDLGSGFGGALETIVSQGAQMVVMLGLLIGGMMASLSMATETSEMGKQMATKAKKTTQKWAKKGASRARDKVLAGGVDKEGKTGLERFSQKYGSAPLVGRAITGMSGASSKAKARLGKDTDQTKEKYKDRTKEDMENMLNRRQVPGSVSPAETAARGLTFLEKGGKFEELRPAAQSKLIDSAKTTGKEKDFMAFAPTLAAEFGKEIKDVMGSLKDSTKLSKAALGNSQVSLNMSIPQIDKLGKEGETENKAAFLNTIMSDQGIAPNTYKEFKANEKELDKFKQKIKDAADAGDKDKVKELQAQRNELKAKIKDAKENLEDSAKKAYKILESMGKKEHWQDEIDKKIS
ncbi:MAG: hypothetical protein WDZ80_04905 [Candidatus Paceibacterota bacterium]